MNIVKLLSTNDLCTINAVINYCLHESHCAFYDFFVQNIMHE